ncbi:MAG: ABC transporter ATP-binding protein [Spirochaetia bacterium]|nr:ABC transporter ATP-binding protein [Spirochaetia bacterium]
MSVLKLDRVVKEFPSVSGKTVEVLRGLDLDVAEGDTLAILGQSGSGKSTLLSLIAGLDLPSRGAVVLGGRDLATLAEDELARFRSKTLGIIFQQFHLMPHLTAFENVLLPLELAARNEGRGASSIKERALAALEQVGLSHRLDHYPAQLSGGESQRVAIARAICVEPALLLADEPTGNLDEANHQKVADLIFELVDKNKMTLLLVTHNPTLAARCKKQVRLAEGLLHS